MKKLFYNASFYLLNRSNDIAQAILTENGVIKEIFFGAIPSLADYEAIDLKGSHVYAGFIDTHTHSFEGGLYSQSINLSKVSSINEALELIRDFYHVHHLEKLDVMDAFRFDENNVIEKRFPTQAELDSVCTDMPLVLRRIDGHSSAVNSMAWEKFCLANAGYVKTINSTAGKDVIRGELNDKVVHWFLDNLSEQTILKAYVKASEIAAANGFTTIHTMVGDSQKSITHYKLLQAHLKQFDIEYILYPQSFDIRAALDAGAKRIGGCILVDGSLGSYTAALRNPYSDKPETSGILYHDNAFWESFIREAHQHQLQVAVHCIGDRAIKQVNDIYLSLYREQSHDLRHELIHCELTPDDLLDEIVQSHAIPVMQPAFDLYWGGQNRFYEKVLGSQRSLKMNRFKSFIDKGVPVTGGSDWYITELDALQGIRAAVNHHNPQERIDPATAIKMYTSNAAYLSHDEQRLGMLDKNFEADFVCLSDNILTESGLNKAKVLATYKKGKQIFKV
jgi:hypothetical protein